MIKKRVNRNATMSLIVAFAMIFSIFSVIAGGNGDTAYLTKKLVSDEYTIEEGRIVMEGFYTRGHPGAPELPQKTYDIPLPPDAELETVQLEILASTAHIIVGEYDIGPGPLPAAGSGYTIPYGSIVNGKDTAIYGNNDFYPLLPVEILRTYQTKDTKIVRIQFTSLQYNPVSKKLQLIEEVTVKISWDKGFSMAKAAPPASWSGYVIVTTNAIVSNSANLSTFITHLQNRGFTVTTITETQYGGATGQPRAINIRNWLAANYIGSQVQYVLLIGDPDPDDPADTGDTFGDVPMMMCWPNPASVPDQTPTDYFYADLTGNWDSDGDTFYGEFGQDTVDFGPEVYVGRIPVYGGNYAALDSILNKLINYNGATKSIMLPMAISNYKDEDNFGNSCSGALARTDGLDLPWWVDTVIAIPNGYTIYVMYETAGLMGLGHDPVPPTAYHFNASLTNANAINQWSNDYGIVFWWAHGSQTNAWRKYWQQDLCPNSVPQDWFCCPPGEFAWPNLLASGDTPALPNTDTFTFQCSCYNGFPENSTNLGYSLLFQGAVSTVSASRISWYAVATWANWGMVDNAGIGYEYVNLLVDSRYSSGKALYDGKNALANPWGWQGWQNLFDFNLYGDPSLTLKGPPVPIPPPTGIVNPIAAFMPITMCHLRQVNTCLECITDNLPEDVPSDVQTLLDEMQEHINNANTTGNSIYANNELLKALKCCEDIQEILGITCPL